MTTTGIIYVATGHDAYLQEAVLSASSVKERTSLHITLFTDRSGHRLCRSNIFDKVVGVEKDLSVRTDWSRGLLDKVSCLSRTPYQRTLFLDTDTIVRTRDLMALFDLAAEYDIGMAEADVEDSYSRRFYERPIFNTGVIFYRTSPPTLTLLNKWVVQSERNFRIAREAPLRRIPEMQHVSDSQVCRRLLGNDQISLAPLLSPGTNRCGVKVITLDRSWNYRVREEQKGSNRMIRIQHLARPAPVQLVCRPAITLH